MKMAFESTINKILSQAGDKDIAMITAFLTDSHRSSSLAENRERNKQLEKDLNDLGYQGYVKAAGSDREEVFLVLNVGNTDFEEFLEDMGKLQLRYGQQHILVWKHEQQKAFLTDADGRINETKGCICTSLTVQTLSDAWTQIQSHRFEITECCLNSNFSDRFNKDGNFMTAMMYESKRKRLRKGMNI